MATATWKSARRSAVATQARLKRFVQSATVLLAKAACAVPGSDHRDQIDAYPPNGLVKTSRRDRNSELDQPAQTASAHPVRLKRLDRRIFLSRRQLQLSP